MEDRLKKATEAMYRYIAEYPKFPLPACYAHPAVLRRMIDIIAQERTRCVAEALELLKQDLKAMNSSVELEQEEYDEVKVEGRIRNGSFLNFLSYKNSIKIHLKYTPQGYTINI